MGELLSGGEGEFRAQGMGTPGTVDGGHGVASSVSEALDTDLDAYLDRALFIAQKAEPVAHAGKPADAASESTRALLDLAKAESEWLESLPVRAVSTVELKPEPVEPPVVIPEWMRVESGTEAPAASATETAAQVLHATAFAGLPGGSAAGTDISGMPAALWSVPVAPVPSAESSSRAPTPSGNLLQEIPPPPVSAMPVLPWAPPPAAHPPQSWELPVAMPAEPRRILGMKPGAFVGAVAVGALAAGLLVVAGLHFSDGATGASARPSLTVTVKAVPASGIAQTAEGQPVGTPSPVGTLATGSTGTPLPSDGATDTLTPGAVGVVGGPSATTGAVTAGATGGPVGGVQSSATSALPPPSATDVQTGMTGTPPGAQPLASTGQPGGTGTMDTGMQQAAASAAGTVLSTAQGDVRGAADSLRAPQPTEPAAGGAVLTGGNATVVAVRERPARKSTRAAPVPAPTVTEDEFTPAVESPEPSASELALEEPEASVSDGDTSVPRAKVAVSSAQARPPSKYADLDEDFARELGFTEDAESKAEEAPRAKRTVYIPPAPDAKKHLTPDDVQQVVVTNQPAITACIRQHAKGTVVAGGGRFLVKWSVLPSGDTAQVSMDTDTLRATPLARCIEDVVRRWKFPAHRVRMQEPIRFPFVF